jgi:hypothetical protein
MSIGSARGDVQNRGRFVERQAGKRAQLHKLGPDRILGGELAEGFVEGARWSA